MSRPQSGFLPLRPITPGSRQQMKSTVNKTLTMLEELPKNLKIESITEEEFGSILQWDRTVRNTNLDKTVYLEIIDKGYIVLTPGQGHTFSTNLNEEVRYKINGYNTIFKIEPEK